jgi:hypothetical protein
MENVVNSCSGVALDRGAAPSSPPPHPPPPEPHDPPLPLRTIPGAIAAVHPPFPPPIDGRSIDVRSTDRREGAACGSPGRCNLGVQRRQVEFKGIAVCRD